MFNMIVRATVDGIDSPATAKHLDTLKYNWWLGPEGLRLRGTNGCQFWDTAFYVQALLEFLEIPKMDSGDARVQASDCVKRAVWRYFMDQQALENNPNYHKYYRHPNKGGFPFSTKLCNWILSDCTAEALSVLSRIYKVLYVEDGQGLRHCVESDEASSQNELKFRIFLAADCLLTFQNSDGGVASYERVRGSTLLELLDPAELFSNIMVEHSYVECTSAFYKGLSKFHSTFPDYRTKEIEWALKKALAFIISQQREDGSFEGSWGVLFTYATWWALEALGSFSPFVKSNYKTEGRHESLKSAKDKFRKEKAIIKACKFLVGKQNEDGGWGEDFTSCPLREWIPSVKSNIVQTSWALLGLMNVRYPDGDVIKRGIQYLLDLQLSNGDWPEENNTGLFNRTTSIIYVNYRIVFPFWAISRFRKLYGDVSLAQTKK